MIKRGTTTIAKLYRGTTPLIAVYRGIQLVWKIIKSCFGNGYWVNNQPYSNTEAWKNNE